MKRKTEKPTIDLLKIIKNIEEQQRDVTAGEMK